MFKKNINHKYIQCKQWMDRWINRTHTHINIYIYLLIAICI